jgi:hypothetical protein
MQTRETSPSVTSKTEAARMLERRIRAVSLGAGLAKYRKDPLRLFVQCFSEQFEELDRSKTPGWSTSCLRSEATDQRADPGKSGNRAVPSPTPKQLPLFYWSATIRTRSTDWNGSPFISDRPLMYVRETKRTPLRDDVVPRVSGCHITSELLVLPHWRHFDGLNTPLTYTRSVMNNTVRMRYATLRIVLRGN